MNIVQKAENLCMFNLVNDGAQVCC